jgi:hypothetical protein
MDCQTCGAETVAFAVPSAFEDHVPGSESAVSLCTRCLSMAPAEHPPPDEPDFDRISDAFPTNPDGAVAFALLLGLLDNLALYREEITELLAAVEQAGTDPLLAIDRLAADPHIDTDLDLSGRRRQLEQLL